MRCLLRVLSGSVSVNVTHVCLVGHSTTCTTPVVLRDSLIEQAGIPYTAVVKMALFERNKMGIKRAPPQVCISVHRVVGHGAETAVLWYIFGAHRYAWLDRITKQPFKPQHCC